MTPSDGVSSVANVLGIAGHEEDSIATFKCRVVVGDAIDFPAGSRIRCTAPDRTRARALVAGLSGRRVGWLRMSPGWTAGAEAVLSRELVAARVGWRLALVGDEVTVLQARAFAVEAGVLAHVQAEGSLHTLRAHEGTLQLSGGGGQ
ncbi:hypothetical protein JO861_16090 [Rhodococcus hoagii]|uniref:hypothetical protein n=1 Tax=Rhodococcus hoagii TaxID=43767 RepID=UPI00196579A3|nr:hypothetical protein [Prescottella equi]MBM9838067.1 hypothetical protein [Prescottella equi]